MGALREQGTSLSGSVVVSPVPSTGLLQLLNPCEGGTSKSEKAPVVSRRLYFSGEHGGGRTIKTIKVHTGKGPVAHKLPLASAPGSSGEEKDVPTLAASHSCTDRSKGPEETAQESWVVSHRTPAASPLIHVADACEAPARCWARSRGRPGPALRELPVHCGDTALRWCSAPGWARARLQVSSWGGCSA